ncbi:hypothetical protein [Marinicella meishanensis]|uniref:hypothetical protein n=1 Tax=Marinicella meishanensis TaxID=2873263 RepID=UPI001CBD1B5B|nr:hypothetical protein [Marinicella sp. NBU2979]
MAPGNTPQEHQLSSHIDADFIRRAEQDILAILLSQRRQFNHRWQSNHTMNRVKVVLRYVGLLLCLLGLLIVATSLGLGLAWDHRAWPLWAALVVFLLLGWFFWHLPHWETKARAWTERVSQKSCRKLAKKCVKQAAGMVPFLAQYDIKGDQISYHRKQPANEDQAERWLFVWNRTLAGFAGTAEHATVLFKSNRAIQPRIIVLHQDAEPFRTLLAGLQIPTSDNNDPNHA